MRIHDKRDRFVLKCHAGLQKLPMWLHERQYNHLVLGRFDTNGNPVIGLSWKLDREDGASYQRRGLIVVRKREWLDKAEALATTNLKK